MNVLDLAIWGFVATVILTTIMNASQGMGLSRMNLPYILGTMFTPDRDRAKVIGTLFHIVNGWIFSFVYAAAFESLGGASVGIGLLAGFIHATAVLVIVMPLLPVIHPRMASEQHGPSVTRRLEPPGFLGLHYGLRTPVSLVLAHLVYGGFLGVMYRTVGG